MSSHLYGFGASTSAAKAATALSNYATGRSLTRRPSSMFYSSSDVLSAYSSAATGGSSVDHHGTGIKRPYEALYHPTLLGAHSMFGQSEAWYSANSLAKRSRLDNAISLPVYPQRPGEKDCVYYMQTRTCKFGESCRFDHPIWVPEGGIPDWKEVPLVDTSTSLPERPGAPDCPYFLKTQKCKFGMKCKFSHPKDKLTAVDSLENVDISALPERPSEPLCAFYLKTGKCKFSSSCKFHHPKDIQVPSAGQENGTVEHVEAAIKIAGTTGNAKPFVPSTPAFLFNSKELPIRLGEPDCPFYLKTGSCKYGASCRYSHPERTAAAISHPILATQAANLNLGVLNPFGSMYQTIDPRLTQSLVRVGPTVYPQRPGEIECDYYMKTGECKFGERCRFHHPIDRSAREMSAAKQAQEQTVELTLAGLPRREGSIHCPYYMKTGTCMYGVNCKFDHPPPGEVMASTASQGTTLASSVG